MKPLEDMGRFKTVVVDPPWDVTWYSNTLTLESRDQLRQKQLSERKGLGLKRMPGYVQMPYPTMSLDEIKALPIPEVLEPDGLVFLWTTMKMLPHAFGVLEAWLVEYDYTMTWHKSRGPKPLNKPMYNAEFVLVGKQGRPHYLEEKMLFTSNSWSSPRVHSHKPEGFYDLLRRVTPEPRMDVFARRQIAGFTPWGDEVPEGEPLSNHYQTVMLG